MICVFRFECKASGLETEQKQQQRQKWTNQKRDTSALNSCRVSMCLVVFVHRTKYCILWKSKHSSSCSVGHEDTLFTCLNVSPLGRRAWFSILSFGFIARTWNIVLQAGKSKDLMPTIPPPSFLSRNEPWSSDMAETDWQWVGLKTMLSKHGFSGASSWPLCIGATFLFLEISVVGRITGTA